MLEVSTNGSESPGRSKAVQMVSDELANRSDEGLTVGKTFAGPDFTKLKGSSGVGLPTARSHNAARGSNEIQMV